MLRHDPYSALQARPRLPRLSGSAVEIAQANHLRRRALSCELNQIDRMPVPRAEQIVELTGEPIEGAIDLVQSALAYAGQWQRWMAQEARAAWWIEHSHGIDGLCWAALDEALCTWVSGYDGSGLRKVLRDAVAAVSARCEAAWG